MTLDDGRACVDVPGGTANRWDAAIGQNDIDLVAGETYRFSFYASGDAGPRGPGHRRARRRPLRHLLRGVAGPRRPRSTTRSPSPRPPTPPRARSRSRSAAAPTRGASAWTTSRWSAACRPRCTCRTPARGSGSTRSPTCRTARRTPPWSPTPPPRCPGSSGTRPARWSRAAPARRAASTCPPGRTCSPSTSAGTPAAAPASRITADGETSRPFDIDAAAYEKLRADALKFYYTQRSGIEILDSLRPGYGRPAGHVDVAPNLGDGNVPCQPGVCDYTLDVRGGWYDAGDHGKYVVNGGISTWQLLSEYEQSPRASGKLSTTWPSRRAATGCRTSSTRPAGSWTSCSGCRCRPVSRSPAWPTTRSTTPTGPACRCCRTSTRSSASCTRSRPPRRSTWPPPPPRPPASTSATTRRSRRVR